MPNEVPALPLSIIPGADVLASIRYHEIALARRSAYLMTQESRTAYEHHIPPVVELRYSVTFRTLR